MNARGPVLAALACLLGLATAPAARAHPHGLPLPRQRLGPAALMPAAIRMWGMGAGLTLLMGCSSMAPRVDFKEPGEIAGTWRGQLTGRSGSATAALTISPTGAFSGTMYLDGEDKDFGGAITVVRPGLALYRGSQGSGTVTLRERGGKRTLHFQPDGGGIASTLARSP